MELHNDKATYRKVYIKKIYIKKIYYTIWGSDLPKLHICLGRCGNVTAQRTYQLQVLIHTFQKS